MPVIAGFFGVFGVGAHVARAHALCSTPSPADGSTVATAPASVSCGFTEPPTSDSSMWATDACGQRADDGRVSIVAENMSVGMTARYPSTYTVFWKTTSQVDGHHAYGQWSYAVAGAQDPCAGAGPSPVARTPTPSPAPAGRPGTPSRTPTAAARPSPAPTPSGQSLAVAAVAASPAAAAAPGATRLAPPSPSLTAFAVAPPEPLVPVALFAAILGLGALLEVISVHAEEGMP
ncbi:MAG: copper resistance CopC family protein [Candidatus Dormibacteria bacterium]